MNDTDKVGMIEKFFLTDNVDRKNEMFLVSFPRIIWRKASIRGRLPILEASLNLCILVEIEEEVHREYFNPSCI